MEACFEAQKSCGPFFMNCNLSASIQVVTEDHLLLFAVYVLLGTFKMANRQKQKNTVLSQIVF